MDSSEHVIIHILYIQWIQQGTHRTHRVDFREMHLKTLLFEFANSIANKCIQLHPLYEWMRKNNELVKITNLLMVLFPVFQPLNHTFHIAFQIFILFTSQLLNNLRIVTLTRFIQNGLHNFTFDILLDFVNRIPSIQ